MLLYNRIRARPSCLLPAETTRKAKEEMKMEVHPSPNQPVECFSPVGCLDSPVDYGPSATVNCSGSNIANGDEDLSSSTDPVEARGDIEIVDSEASTLIVKDLERLYSNGCFDAPEEVDSIVEHASQPATGNISAICTSSTQSEAHNIKPSFSMSDVENERGSKNVNEGLLVILGKDYSNTQNHTSQKDNEADDVSAMAFTSDGVHEELNSTNFISTPQIAKSENSTPSLHGIQVGARKSSGVIYSGAKLNPLLAPGFLGKRPQNKCAKQGVSELASNSHLNSQTNGIVMPHLTRQNGYLLPDEEKHYSGQICLSNNLDGQTGMFDNDTLMAPGEADMSISLLSGVASDPIIFCKGTKIDKANERLRVGGHNLIYRGKS